MTAGTARAARGTPVAGGAPLRFPRTLLIAGTVLGLAAAAHTAGGGALPPVPVMALLTAFTVLPVMALSRFRLSLAAMAATLAAGQLLLHAAFTALAALPSHCGAGGIAAHGHHHDFAIPDCAVTSTAAAAGPRLPEIADSNDRCPRPGRHRNRARPGPRRGCPLAAARLAPAADRYSLPGVHGARAAITRRSV